jgi:hypothetical protein
LEGAAVHPVRVDIIDRPLGINRAGGGTGEQQGRSGDKQMFSHADYLRKPDA